jgi:hypothetical protein
MLDKKLCDNITKGVYKNIQSRSDALKNFVENNAEKFGSISTSDGRRKFEEAATALMLEERCTDRYRSSGSSGVTKEKIFVFMKMPLLILMVVSFLIHMAITINIYKPAVGSTGEKIINLINQSEELIELIVLITGSLFLLVRMSTFYQFSSSWRPNYMFSGVEIFILDILLSFILFTSFSKLLKYIKNGYTKLKNYFSSEKKPLSNK